MKPELRLKFDPPLLPAFKKCIGAEAVPKESKHFLLPGQLCVSLEPVVISTILGSCVALCLWDIKLGIGGMNHYLLPEGCSSGVVNLRYGNLANAELLKRLLAVGGNAKNLQAMIFGGASMFSSASLGPTLGERNIRHAIEFVESTNIPVMAKDVAGKSGRRLTFHTKDGTAAIRSFENG